MKGDADVLCDCDQRACNETRLVKHNGFYLHYSYYSIMRIIATNCFPIQFIYIIISK